MCSAAARTVLAPHTLSAAAYIVAWNMGSWVPEVACLTAAQSYCPALMQAPCSCAQEAESECGAVPALQHALF